MVSRRERIVVIDDTEMVRKVLVHYLERLGFATLEAADGQEGLDVIRANKPDLVLCDLPHAQPRRTGRPEDPQEGVARASHHRYVRGGSSPGCGQRASVGRVGLCRETRRVPGASSTQSTRRWRRPRWSKTTVAIEPTSSASTATWRPVCVSWLRMKTPAGRSGAHAAAQPPALR